MATWGYRVYAFGLKYGRDQLPLHDQSIRDSFAELVADLQIQGTVTGVPRIRDVGVAEGQHIQGDVESFRQSTPTLTVKSMDWRQSDHLHMLVSMGEVGLHEDAVDPRSQKRQPILDQAAEVTLRMDAYFPRSGTRAVLLAETQGKQDAVRRFFAWLQYRWVMRKEELEKEQKRRLGEWKESKRLGEQVGDRPDTTPYKRYYVSYSQLADAELLQRIIDNAKTGSVEFYELDADGKKLHTLTRQVTTTAGIRTLGQFVRSRGSKNKNLNKTNEQTVLELVEGFDYDFEALESAGLHLEDASVRLQSDEANMVFRMGQATDIFTYPFRKERPKDSRYYRVTINKALALAPAAQIELDDIEDSEVCEWLSEDETRSPSDQPSDTQN